MRRTQTHRTKQRTERDADNTEGYKRELARNSLTSCRACPVRIHLGSYRAAHRHTIHPPHPCACSLIILVAAETPHMHNTSTANRLARGSKPHAGLEEISESPAPRPDRNHQSATHYDLVVRGRTDRTSVQRGDQTFFKEAGKSTRPTRSENCARLCCCCAREEARGDRERRQCHHSADHEQRLARGGSATKKTTKGSTGLRDIPGVQEWTSRGGTTCGLLPRKTPGNRQGRRRPRSLRAKCANPPQGACEGDWPSARSCRKWFVAMPTNNRPHHASMVRVDCFSVVLTSNITGLQWCIKEGPRRVQLVRRSHKRRMPFTCGPATELPF